MKLIVRLAALSLLASPRARVGGESTPAFPARRDLAP